MNSEAISYTVGFVSRKRPFSTEAQIRLSYTVETGLRLNFFRLSFPTVGSSRKTRLFRLDLCRQSKNSVEKVLHLFLNPSHRSSHHKTHTHTPTHPYQVPHSSISYNSADAALAITAASRRKSAWRTPSSARQQHVSHDSSSARYRCHFANNVYASCSFGGSRLSATP